MKKTLLSICCLFTCIYSLQAQSLFGITYRGGTDAGGSINKFVPATNSLLVERSFQRTGANPYYTNLIQATDGKLYGMTFNGGSSSGGVIFSYNTDSSNYSKLYDFDITNGSKPTGSLMQASDGKLYGMTNFGGVQNEGVIFSFDPSSKIYKDLYDFDITHGANPSGSFIQAADGKLYGMATGGGSNNFGVIFSFDPATSAYTKLKDFDGINGGSPLGDLTRASDGLLFGMTANGGSKQAGVIFSFNITSLGYNKLKDFDSSNGYYPYGSLLQAANGKFYGMTYKGGSTDYGVIFSFDPVSSAYTKLDDLDSANGGDPFGNLLLANDGKLYGETSAGGNINAGVIFSFDTSSLVYTKLRNFDNTTGGMPFGSLMQAKNGKLYALTFQGGITKAGVVFSYDIPTTNYISLKDFGTNVSGRNPSGSLVLAKDGKLYGMTVLGGAAGKGVIFSFDPSLQIFTKLIDFDSSNGANGYGSLMQATDGKLYGMTLNGGSKNTGVIFSLDPVTVAYTKLKDLDATNGINPYGSLIQATDGKLYGMTSGGGNKNSGTIFSLDLSSAAFNKLKDFDSTNGANPYGSLVQATDGKLYGITSSGGAGYIQQHNIRTGAGVLFSYDPSSAVYTKLADFDYYNNGGFGYGSLVQVKNGKLYGMNSMGGSGGSGVVFSYNPAGKVFSILSSFNTLNGSNPYGNLIQAHDGKLYGMTYNGGLNNFGVVFSFDTTSATITHLVDFTDDNGNNPYYGSAFIEVPDAGPLPVTLLSFKGKNNPFSNQLLWIVANQQQLNYYELQRSSDGQYFTGISHITPAAGNSYSYNDNINTATSSVYYYRLKCVDIDGKFTYSNIVQLSRNANENAVAVFPNPFKDNLVVSITTLMQDKATFILTDISGRQLYKAMEQLHAGTNIVGINGVAKLPKGTYMLTIVTSQHTQTIKVVKGE